MTSPESKALLKVPWGKGDSRFDDRAEESLEGANGYVHENPNMMQAAEMTANMVMTP